MFGSNGLRLPGFFIGWMIFCVAMAVGVIGFIAWVIIKLMQHFGII